MYYKTHILQNEHIVVQLAHTAGIMNEAMHTSACKLFKSMLATCHKFSSV
jgi:hypothetical protein